MKTSAIVAAYALLKKFNPKREHLDEALSRHLAKYRKQLGDADFGIASGLCQDVVRHAALIDHLIAHVSTTAPSKMERQVLAAVRLGVVNRLRGAPDHAAVNEAVNLLPEKHRARGLVNAVVRRVLELIQTRELTDEERAGLKQTDASIMETLISPTALPFGSRLLIETPFATFPEDANERLMLLSGVPQWLYETLGQTLADEERTQVCIACSMEPKLWLRVTPGREDDVQALTHNLESVDTADLSQPLSIDSSEAAMVLSSKAFRSGALSVQDYSAQRPVRMAPPKIGAKCADFCAAPGGKTVQIALAVGEQGSVIAFDQNQKKLARIKENLDRHELRNVAGAFGDGREVELPGVGEFEYVLLDAPCSNTGVMARRTEVMQRLAPRDLKSLEGLQIALLKNAAEHLAYGGTLIYSTCSLLDEENGGLVRKFLESQGGESSGWAMQDEVLTLPLPGKHDGGYFCVLRAPME